MSQSNATYLESHILRRFNIIKKVGSGAYGHVWKVEEKTSKKTYALKKIFDAFQHATDAQRTYREIQILRQTNHPNIIRLHDTLRADNSKDVYLVFEFMQADLHNVISEDILKDVHVRFIVYQLAKALKYLHTGMVIHRDLKPSNVLVNSNCAVKLCDFGLVRSLGVGVGDSTGGNVLTQGVATRWYRAPQVLLGSKSYSTPADVWSFGCIIYEVLAQKPLFAGTSTLDQLEKICSFTGYPCDDDIKAIQSQVSKSMLKQIKSTQPQGQSASILKDITGPFRDLLERMIVFNPEKRITVQEILQHQLVKAFHKPEQEVACKGQITTSIDDNKKLSVEEYRKLIYSSASNAVGSNGQTIVKSSSAKLMSTSLGSGSGSGSSSSKKISSELNSAKNILNNSSSVTSKTTATNQTSSKTKLASQHNQAQTHSKKYSQDNLRTLNKSASQHINPGQTANTSSFSNNNCHTPQQPPPRRTAQKQTLKYVRSAKDFLRNGHQNNSNQHTAGKQQQQQAVNNARYSYQQHQQQQSLHPKANYSSGGYKKGHQSQQVSKNNKSTASLGTYQEENREQVGGSTASKYSAGQTGNKSFTTLNRPTYVSKTFYSPKNHMQPTKSSMNHVTGMGNGSGTGTTSGSGGSIWGTANSSKAFLNKEVKDKTYLFKSQKYIKDFKTNNNNSNDTSLLKKKQKQEDVGVSNG